jgi:PAS domain S-box-containing protein
MRLIKIILLFVVCLSSVAFAKDEHVTLKLKWKHQFQFAGYYAALHKGFYKEAGLDVDIQEANLADNHVESVLSRVGQYGVGNSDLLLYRQRGYKPVLLAVFLQHSPLILLARQDSNINTPADFNGKTILLEQNSNEIMGWLKKVNLSDKNVNIKIQKHDMSELVNRHVDAISAYSTTEPALLSRLGIKYKIFSPLDVGIDFYGDNLFTSEREMTDNPDRAKAFRDASIKGWKYAIANKEEMVSLIYEKYSKRLSITELTQEADETIKLMELDFVEPGYYKEGRWRHIANTYTELKMLPQDISFSGFFYEQYIGDTPTWLVRAIYITIFVMLILLAVIWGFYSMNKKIKVSRQRYKTLYEKAPTAYIVADSNGIIIDWNKEAQKVFGYTKEEALGKDMVKLLVPEYEIASIASKVKNLLEHSEEFVSTNKNITKDKKIITCEWANTPFFDDSGKGVGIVSMATDVTEKELLLSKLRDSEQMFKNMLEQAPFPVVITDYITSDVIFVNQATADAVGESRSKLLKGKAIDYWVDLTDRDIYVKEITKKGYLDNLEVRFKRKNGTVFWAQMSATRMVCDHQDAAFIVFMDIDVQKKMQESLKAQMLNH